MSGFIQLHRKILEWEWWDDHNTVRVFLYCLLKANWKPSKWKGFEITRGQFPTGLDTLSREIGLSKQQIRTCLNKLQKSGNINTQSTNKFSIVTVVNYDSYQSDNTQSTNNTTHEQHSNNIQITTLEEDNKYNNRINNNIPPNPHEIEFENLWNEYKPYDMAKGNKQSALKSYLKTRKGTDYEAIIRGVTRYIEYCHSTKCKTKHVCTWLNQCGWSDDYDIPSSKNEKPSYFDQLASASRAVQHSYQHQDNED